MQYFSKMMGKEYQHHDLRPMRRNTEVTTVYKLFLVKMNLTHYMLEIYLKSSMKVTYLNYLDYPQQIISEATLMSKYHFLKILGKKEALLM